MHQQMMSEINKMLRKPDFGGGGSEGENKRLTLHIIHTHTHTHTHNVRPQAPQVMTIREYDQTELRKYVTQNLMVIAICTFIHIKWAICPPLFIQCFVMPQSFYGKT